MANKPENTGPAFKHDDMENDIHADFSQMIHVDTNQLAWEASPAPGVERKRLELIGDTDPQLTTIVRFAPGSEFAPHTHDGGEEFLVISGVFSDTSGDYGQGFYVRNPPGTRHSPFTKKGCVILVKLRQFQTDDLRQCAIPIADANDPSWQPLSSGIKIQELHQYQDEKVAFFKLQTGSKLPQELFAQGVEIYVINGNLQLHQENFAAGSWLRFPAGSQSEVYASENANIYLKTGPGKRYAIV